MRLLIFISILAIALSCSTGQEESKAEARQYADITGYNLKDTLFRVCMEDADGPGDSCGYVNQRGDTIIPIGRYTYCFTDTFTTFAIVLDTSTLPIAIGPDGRRLFEVYWYDNGPDYVEDGLFRILRNGKVGYADTTGRVVIEPQFDCAFPFSEGKARVAYDCKLEKSGDEEHTSMVSDSWFYIDRKGQKIE